MTAHKHFKQLVRTRMSQTGESYTTARRKVIRDSTVGADAGPARWHLPGSIPATTALRILLTAAGVRDPRTGKPYSEATLFAICGGIGMGIASFYYAASDFASFYIAGRHLWYDHVAYLTNGLQRFGIKAVIRETAGAKAAENHLRDALKDGPCIAWVDGYHVITVYAIDDSRGVALIGDLADEPQQMELARLAETRGRIKQYKNRLLSVSSGTANQDVVEMVRSGLQACQNGLKRGKKGPETMSGLERLAALRDQLAPGKQKENWRQVFPRGHRLWTALTSLHDYVEHHHTGGGLCRPIFAEALSEAADLPGLKKLADISGLYSDLGTDWTDLAMTALPPEVRAFNEARELFTRRAETTSNGGPSNRCDAEIARQKDVARKEFPLNDTQCEELLGCLHQKVSSLYEKEIQARAALCEAR